MSLYGRVFGGLGVRLHWGEGKCIEVEDGSSVLEAEIRAGVENADAPCGDRGNVVRR